ncbi:MAG TPA: alanine/glycine:cation symporter family protein [Jiangellales bacterium]|nr:alanine/glycine:cation symporter family protein [Jiangellales bacterium]
MQDEIRAQSVDERVGEVVGPIADRVVSTVFYSVSIGGAELPLIVVWLVVAGAFFTVYLGFLNVRGFRHSIDLVRGKYSDPNDAGEVSHFQALATAVSGTVGLGNIAGVAVAISLGGPGATFWMIVAGFLGMSTKLAECTLGVKYRNEHADGTVSGGPMYYLERGVGAVTGSRGFGKTLAILFAIFCIGGALGGGNMFQANQATAQIQAVTGGEDSPLAGLNWLVGLAFAIAVGLVIIGGIKSIARVTEKLVPFMAVLYLTAGVVVIAFNLEAVPGAIGDIISGAFNPQGVAGGFVGVLIVGFQRAAFSNEAGIGSASIAHSAVRTKHPSTEGYVALLEPFIDTIVICTMTALIIVITGAYLDPEAAELGGVALTSNAFESVIPWFPNVLAVAVVLFAFSTMISWSYYGMKATGYIFNDSAKAELVFKFVFVVFTVIGAALALEPVIGLSDSMIFLMAIPNVIGLYILARTLKKELTGYRAKVDSGEFAQVEK